MLPSTVAATGSKSLSESPSPLHSAVFETDHPVINTVYALSGLLSIILLYRGVDLALDYLFPDDTPLKITVVFALFAVCAAVSYTAGALVLRYQRFRQNGGLSWRDFFFRQPSTHSRRSAPTPATSATTTTTTTTITIQPDKQTAIAAHVAPGRARGNASPGRFAVGGSVYPSKHQRSHAQKRSIASLLQGGGGAGSSTPLSTWP